jgi:cytochrome c-type biogenesis protein CcmH/NrfG
MSNDALIAKYEALLKARPKDELILFSLGKALLDAGRVDEADACLRMALDLKPDWMIVTMLLARIAGQRKDIITEKELWEKGLHLAVAQNHEGPEEECRAELRRIEQHWNAQQASGQ